MVLFRPCSSRSWNLASRALCLVLLSLTALRGVTLTAAELRPPATAEKNAIKRKAPLPLSRLPAPKAGGPLHILVVDDDWSDNNGPDGNGPLSGSDQVFRDLAAAAVGGQAAAWSVAVVERYKNGPTLDRLRDFNVVLWYTGGSYGGGADNAAVLSLEDEKTARRYLEEVGGAFILISPGYVNNLSYGSTWTDSVHPFLKDVAGINGFSGLVQRFTEGTVQAQDGSSYTIEAKGAAEAQFSAVNSNGAAMVFTAALDARKTAEGSVPVAVAHAYGSGRFVYVGFTFENIPESERTRAFGLLLSAAIGPATGGAPAAAPVTMSPTQRVPAGSTMQTLQVISEAPPGPPPTNLRMTASEPNWHQMEWIAPPGAKTFEVFRRDGGRWIFVGESFSETRHIDSAFLPPNPAAYKVVAVYADGRRGEAVVEYPNPPQPQAPTGLKAVQVNVGAVQLDWVNVPRQRYYRIFCPGISSGYWADVPTPLNNPAGTGRAIIDQLPVGVHEIRLAARYTDTQPDSTPYATVQVAVNLDHGRYRVVFLGVRVDEPAADDVLDFDGKGNEIFAGGFWATTPSWGSLTAPASGGGFARTVVYGATQGFPDRIRAGTAGPTGGLRAGDYAPNQNAVVPQPGVSATSDRFPLTLWEGELVDHGPIVAVIPIVFEWSATNHVAWSYWADWWTGSVILPQLGIAMRDNADKPLAPQAFNGTWSLEDNSKRNSEVHDQLPLLPGFNVETGYDRPIGLKDASRPGHQRTFGHRPMGFALTHSRVEAALAGQPARVLELTWTDDLSGKYTGFFQLERLSEPPYVVPAATATPTMTSTTMATPVMGTAVQSSAPAPATIPEISRLPAKDSTLRKTKAPETPPPGSPPKKP